MLLIQQASPQLPIGRTLLVGTYRTRVVDVGVSTRWVMSDMDQNGNFGILTPIRAGLVRRRIPITQWSR